MQPDGKTIYYSENEPPAPFPDFDPNYPLDKVDDNLKQLRWDDATPQPLSCKEKELPTTQYAQRREKVNAKCEFKLLIRIRVELQS